MAQSQVALAGYRLALLLDSIYSSNAPIAGPATVATSSLRGARTAG